MNVAIRPSMTLEQFLAWEERQELRYEFDGTGPVAMTGGTLAHSIVQINLIAALHVRLRGSPCRVIGSDLKIEVAGRIRYPDVFVMCTPSVQGEDRVRDPVVIFEVLSPGTANTAFNEKNAEYRATPSVQRYVILPQDSDAVVVFHRKGGDWVIDFTSGLDAVLDLPEINVAIPLREIYEGVEFPSSPGVRTA